MRSADLDISNTAAAPDWMCAAANFFGAARVTATARPVFARHAASLLLWREGAAGLEVLMGQRNAGARFMPSRLVFPGGAVDPGDRRTVGATEPHPETLALLQRRARPPLARALLLAAARELEEETGLSLGHPPRLDPMRYLCRAVTPPASRIRFNARFFVAPASAAHGTPVESDELQHVRFYGIEEAAALDLMQVTREVLGRLRAYLADPDGARDYHVYKGKVWRPD